MQKQMVCIWDAWSTQTLYLLVGHVTPCQEATEVMEDSCGRWFSFVAEPSTVMILEKKTVPDHLKGLPCIDSPVCLSSIIRELEDSGEVGSYSPYVVHVYPLLFAKNWCHPFQKKYQNHLLTISISPFFHDNRWGWQWPTTPSPLRTRSTAPSHWPFSWTHQRPQGRGSHPKRDQERARHLVSAPLPPRTLGRFWMWQSWRKQIDWWSVGGWGTT